MAEETTDLPRTLRAPGLRASVRALARSTPGYAALLLVDALVMVSELTLGVILPWWITSRGGAGAVALYSAALAVAMLVAMPLASPFGDRWGKARQIQWGTTVLGAIAAAYVLLAATDTFSLATLVGLGFVHVGARAFVAPASEVIVTELVPPAHLPDGIRVRKAAHAISAIAGPLAAGLALATLGVAGALCVYGALVGLACVAALRLPRPAAQTARHAGVRDWWDELVVGMAAKWRVPLERGWTLVNFVMWIFQGPAVGMLIPIKVHALGLSGDWLGIAMSALAAGVLLGSLTGADFLVARLGRYRVRILVGVLEGLALALVGLAAAPWLMVAALVAAGFCNACLGLIGATHRALAVPRAFRSRMVAAQATATQLAGAIGPLLVGVALARWNVDVVYTAFGLAMAPILLGFTLVPRFKEFLTMEHGQIVDWYAREYPEVFGAPARRAACAGAGEGGGTR